MNGEIRAGMCVVPGVRDWELGGGWRWGRKEGHGSSELGLGEVRGGVLLGGGGQDYRVLGIWESRERVAIRRGKPWVQCPQIWA